MEFEAETQKRKIEEYRKWLGESKFSSDSHAAYKKFLEVFPPPPVTFTVLKGRYGPATPVEVLDTWKISESEYTIRVRL